MARRTLIVGPTGTGKTEIALEHAGVSGAAFLNLDPANQDPGPLCAAMHFSPSGEAIGASFIGSLRPTADPLATLAAAAKSRRLASGSDLIVEYPVDHFSPPAVHLVRNVISVLDPTDVVVVGIADSSFLQFPNTQLESPRARTPLPALALAAARRSQWARYMSGAQVMEISLSSVRLSGARIGSGIPLEPSELQAAKSAGFSDAKYGETCGASLLILGGGSPPPEAFPRAADLLGCRECKYVDPQVLIGAVVGLETESGVLSAVGRIDGLDFERNALRLIAPLPDLAAVRRVRIGRHRLTHDFEPAGELKAWQV